MPWHDVAQSRWAKSPTSFGPTGRIIATMLTIAFGPWTVFGGIQFWNPFFLWYFCGYMLAAVPVLKHVWARVKVTQPRSPSSPEARRLELRHPVLFRRIQPNRRTIVFVLGSLLLGGFVVAWTGGGTLGRYTIVVIGVMTAVGMFIAWVADV